MSKPPKIVIPGLNRGAGIPPGYILGRPPGTGKGPAQLLNLGELRRVGLATAAGATQSTSLAISTAHSETVSLSSGVSTVISGSMSAVNSRIDSLSTAGGGGGGAGTSTSLSQISSSLSSEISTDLSRATSLSTVISGSISTVNSRVDSLSTAGGGAVWGTITGTLSDQTDLKDALDAKLTVADDMTTPGSKIYFATGEFGLYVEDSVTTAKAGVEVTGGGFAALRLQAGPLGPFVELTCDTATGFVECGGTDPYNFNQPPCVNGVPIGAASTGGRVLIEERVLGADSATVHFTGIPTTYADLEIEYELRNGTGGTAPASLVFNGDAATNYTTAAWNKFGSSANGGATSVQFGGLEDNAATAEIYNVGKATIFGYASGARYKGLIGQSIYPSIASIEQYGGLWRSNAAIDELLMVTTPGPLFKAGSRIRIYGIA